MSFGNQATQHRHGRGFACSILSQKREDLSIIHLKVDTFNSLEAVWVSLGKTLDLHVLIIKLESCNLGRHWLVVLFGEVLHLERVCTGIFLILFELFVMMTTLAAACEAAAERVALTVLLW